MTAPLRVVVADDEEIARRRLVRLASAVPGVEVCGEARDGAEVLARVRLGDVDVLLLDIRMPGLTGLDAMGLLPAGGPVVVFCTAHADHAVNAFDAGAIDYVLKPVDAARLHKALERARARVAERAVTASAVRVALRGGGSAAGGAAGNDVSPVGSTRVTAAAAMPAPASSPAVAAPAPAPPERLAIPTRDGVVLLDPHAISHAVLDDALVTVFCDGHAVLTDASLAELAERLPTERFVRAHRRALVNLHHVGRLAPNDVGGYTAHLLGGARVEVSRAAARDLRRRLGLRRGPADGDDLDEDD